MGAKKIIYRGAICSLISVATVATVGCHILSATSTSSKLIKVSYSSTKDIIYTPKDWSAKVKGDLYSPKRTSSEKSPVVLLVHGGGWAENDNRYQMKGIARKLAKRGFVVFNVTYRLAPEYHFPAPVDDLLEALKWLKKNEAKLNIDMERVGIYGYSAGGHLAELAAMREMPKGVKIKAVVAGGTPHFMRLDPDFYMVKALIGNTYEENPKPYHKATPVDQVGKNFPPVFIYHGAKDDLVPPVHVQKWVKRLNELDVEHKIYWVKGRGHIGTFLLPREAVTKAAGFLEQKL